MKDQINLSRRRNNKIIDIHLYSEYAEEVDDNLEDWEVYDMTSTEIEIDLTFKDPLQVSSGWTRDQLVVDINLTDYETKLGENLRRIILMEEIPRQISSASEQEVLENL